MIVVGHVGPRADGTFPPEAVERLRIMGQWMRMNGEAIYGTTESPIYAWQVGWSTQRGSTVYIHALRWPGRELHIGWCGNRVVSARMHATGEPLVVDQRADRVRVCGLPEYAPDPYVTVIELELEGTPRKSDPE